MPSRPEALEGSRVLRVVKISDTVMTRSFRDDSDVGRSVVGGRT